MPEYRLDELATLSGVSARNIRAYRERGLLDPPRREGRSAFYEDRHLSQLRAINELLRKGFTSAHIADFISSTREGRDLASILGLRKAVFGAPGHGAALAIDVNADGDDAQKLLERGLAELVDGRLTLVDREIAEIVGRVTEQLPYVQTMLRVSDGVAPLLEEFAAAIAGALAEGLSARFGPNYEPAPKDVAALRQTVADYRMLGGRVAADQLEDALRRHLADEASTHTWAVMLGGDGDHADD